MPLPRPLAGEVRKRFPLSLNQRRSLTVQMIKTLHGAWAIPLEFLIVVTSAREKREALA